MTERTSTGQPEPVVGRPVRAEAARLAEIRETLFTGGYDASEGEKDSTDTTWTDFGEAIGIAEALVADLERAEGALRQIAESYPWEPYDEHETVHGQATAIPTNRRIARKALGGPDA